MTSFNHTPGPWHVPCFAEPGVCSCKSILSPHQTGMGSICQVPHGGEDEPLSIAIANARLIAAAPELLAALIHIEQVAMADEPRDLPGIVKTARQAIAKARI
jgi:hypothetical protein